jgi:hypothetical protein
MRYVIGGVGVLFLTLAIHIYFSRKRFKRMKQSVQEAFERTYSDISPMPALEVSFEYGFPHFTVMFRAKEDLNAATENGVNDSFKSAVATLCKDWGSKSRPFDASLGTYLTYEGHLEEQLAKMRAAGVVIDLNRPGFAGGSIP